MKTQINSLKISLVLVVLFLSNVAQSAKINIILNTINNVTFTKTYNIGDSIIFVNNMFPNTSLNTLNLNYVPYLYGKLMRTTLSTITTPTNTPNNDEITMITQSANSNTTTIILNSINITNILILSTTGKNININLSYNIPTSIKFHQSQDLGLKVFPNPSTDKVNITGNNLKTAVVYNLTGDAIITKNEAIVTEQITLSLEDYAAGVYYIKTTDVYNQTSIKKIVKL